MGLIKQKKKTYANIISDGTIRIASTQEDENAVLRKYELSDGTKGEKWELVFDAIDGVILDIQILEEKYGKVIKIELDRIILSINTNTNFASDLMKKLPNIDLSKKVKFDPYSFVDPVSKKIKRGITVYQNGNKINDFFYDATTKEKLNGLPQPVGDTKGFDKNDWKVYFIGVNKFLQAYTIDNVIPKIENNEEAEVKTPFDDDNDEINVDDIPFDNTVDKSNETTTQTVEQTNEVNPILNNVADEPAQVEEQTNKIPFDDPRLATNETDERKLKLYIESYAKEKLGVVNVSDTEKTVMEAFGLAYISSNLQEILKKLQKM